jgi:hypothetical protein
LPWFSFHRCPSIFTLWSCFWIWWADHFWFEIGN